MLTIPEFYEDRDVLITGGTGFMGQVLVEKLLRSCPKLNRIYLVMRKKKGRTIQERIEDIKKIPVSSFRWQNLSNLSTLNSISSYLI